MTKQKKITIEDAAKRLPQDAWLSQSIANKLIKEGPAAALMAHPLGGDQRDKGTAAKVFGSLVDSLVFGGDPGVVAWSGDRRTKAGKAEYSELQKLGKAVIKPQDYERAVACAEAVQSILGPCRPTDDVQRRIRWKCAGTLADCAGTPDLFRRDEGIVIDVKTTEGLEDLDLGRNCVSYGYHVQAAAYLEGVSSTAGIDEERLRFAWVFVSSTYPHETMIATPDDSMLELGRVMWNRAKLQWRGLALLGESAPWVRNVGSFESPCVIEAPSWSVREIA